MTAAVRSAAALVAALACCLAAVVLGAAPAHAARTVDVVLTEAAPGTVQLQAGDSVRFVNGESTSGLPVEHRVTSGAGEGSTAWQYDSGALAPGASSEPFVFGTAGTYVFVDRRGGALLGQDRSGRIVVAAPPPPPAPAPAAPAPAPPPAAAPPAPGPAAPAPGAPAPGAPPPAATGGTGRADLPGLVGGFTVPAPSGVDGAVAPPSIFDGAEAPSVADAPQDTVLAVEGPLPGNATSRPLGLPATVAVLAAAGVLSLLVRVLLAEPAARRERVRPLVPVAVD